jgi:Bacterial protein of unknown function (DUF853)
MYAVRTTAGERQRSNRNSPVYGQYEQAEDREPVYEKLSRKAAARTGEFWAGLQESSRVK